LQLTLIENNQTIIDTTLKILENIRISILNQAFEGKLCPQISSDESAEILLQKIKQNKHKISRKPKLRK
jgi:hypothetical protein